MSRATATGPSPLRARLRRAVAPLVLVLLAGAALVALGASVPHAVAGTAAALGVVLLWRTTGHHDTAPWPAPPEPRRDGARRDVVDLGWAVLGPDGRVTPRAARRVRALALRRLAEHGVDVDHLDDPRHDAAAARLLGAAAYRDIRRLERSGDLPTLAGLRSWLTAVERLDPPAPDERTPR